MDESKMRHEGTLLITVSYQATHGLCSGRAANEQVACFVLPGFHGPQTVRAQARWGRFSSKARVGLSQRLPRRGDRPEARRRRNIEDTPSPQGDPSLS